MANLIHSLKRWYRIIAALFFVFVGLGGFYFFNTQHELPKTAWLGPWISVVIATAINLYWSPLLGVVEGIGMVGEVARLRLTQSMLGSTCAWIALFVGAGLWSAMFVPFASCILTGLWLNNSKNIVSQISQPIKKDSTARIDWRTEIFPFQWRIAVSWISGYFIFQLFTPVVFRTQGAVEAGRLGVSLSIFSAISSVGMSWVAAKVPAMAGSIARGERTVLNGIFRGVAVRCSIFVAWACISFVLVSTVIGYAYPALAAKIASVSVLCLLALVTVCNSFVFSAAAYMRAHKEEPLLVMSVICGVLTALAVFVGSQYSTLITVGGYALVSVFVSLPWTMIIFRKYWVR